MSVLFPFHLRGRRGGANARAAQLRLVCWNCQAWFMCSSDVSGPVASGQPTDRSSTNPWSVLASHCQPILVLPMFVLTGASGAGKTTVGNELLGQITDPISSMPTSCGPRRWTPRRWLPPGLGVSGFVWPSTFTSLGAPNSADRFRESQSSGKAVPNGPTSDRSTGWPWSATDDALETRLRERPAWRGVTAPFVTAMRAFNAHLRARRDMLVVDTTHESIADTVSQVRAWLLRPRINRKKQVYDPQKLPAAEDPIDPPNGRENR